VFECDCRLDVPDVLVLAVCNEPRALMLGRTVSKYTLKRELLCVQWLCLVGSRFEGDFNLILVPRQPKTAWQLCRVVGVVNYC
jgi:hypothetical protein